MEEQLERIADTLDVIATELNTQTKIMSGEIEPPVVAKGELPDYMQMPNMDFMNIRKDKNNGQSN